MLVADMSRNLTFFLQFRILHVLRFTSVCDRFTDSPLSTNALTDIINWILNSAGTTSRNWARFWARYNHIIATTYVSEIHLNIILSFPQFSRMSTKQNSVRIPRFPLPELRGFFQLFFVTITGDINHEILCDAVQ